MRKLYNGTGRIVVYNRNMRKYLIPLVTIALCSCVYYGSGIKIVTGTLSGALLTSNVKIGLFPEDITFYYDSYTNGADPDKIFEEKNAGPAGSYTPVVLGTFPTSASYTITFPDDPSIINCLVAWDDVNGDNDFDLDGSEMAYLPVKTVNGELSVVTNFGYIEEVQVITYIVNYVDIDLYADSDFPDKFTDNFDAIGAGDFNFIFD